MTAINSRINDIKRKISSMEWDVENISDPDIQGMKQNQIARLRAELQELQVERERSRPSMEEE